MSSYRINRELGLLPWMIFVFYISGKQPRKQIYQHFYNHDTF